MYKYLFILSGLFLLTSCSSIAEHSNLPQCESEAAYKTTDSYNDIKAVATKMIEKYGANKVLFASDIDNTLLTMDQYLGSDAWFLWQRKQLKRNKSDEPYKINTFQKLLNAQRLLFDISSMSPMEVQQPNLLNWFNSQGIDTIFITSRGPGTLSSTMRELENNGYKLNNKKFNIENSTRYLPYTEKSLSSLKLSYDELQKFRLLEKGDKCDINSLDLDECIKQARQNAFYNGLYMTSGQHKGLMLKLLLDTNSKKSSDYKAIIFIDDTLHHVIDMYDTFCGDKTEIALFNYIKSEQSNKAFEKMDKTPLIEKWVELKSSLSDFDLQ